MPNVDINDLTSIGMVSDIPSYMLPPEAWGLAVNMRARDGGMERMPGWEEAFGVLGEPPVSPLFPPHFVTHLGTPNQELWVYASLNNVAVCGGVTHTDITRLSGPYSAGASQHWNRTILGGVLVLTNWSDLPQMWISEGTGPPGPANKLQDLENWPATKRCRLMRSFGPYLIALSTIENGFEFPHRVLWSHPADPGGVPISWEIDNPAMDSGQNDLPDVQSGVIVEAQSLRGQMYIYKQESVWAMRFIGGRYVFSFSPVFETTGCIASRCVAATGDGTRHVFVTQDDLVFHDGQQIKSILDKRMRKQVFDELDPVSYGTSFVFCNPEFNEMWFCYPSVGAFNPDTAVVWNYAEGQMGVPTRIEGITFRGVDIGEVEETDPGTWDTAVGTWNTDKVPWNRSFRHKVIAASPQSSAGVGKLLMLDKGTERDGVGFVGMLRREGLALMGKRRGGEWLVDHEQMKMVRRIWPKIQSADPVEIRVGSQMLVNGPVKWNRETKFDPAVSVTASFIPVSGRALGVQFASDRPWRIDGYKYEVVPLGRF